jgi:hypothetical protein
MPNTLIPIQTYTLSSSAASVTFSNIPQNYTDLKIVVSARGTTTNAERVSDITLRINNDSGSSYSYRGLTGVPASGTASSFAFSGTTVFQYFGFGTSSDATASTFGSTEFYFPNYTSSVGKSISVDTVGENNASTTLLRLIAGLWSPSTQAAISTLAFSLNSGNFDTGSTFTLYGISNGVKATGGTLTVAGGYAYHTFTSTGSFLPSQKITGAEVLAVAGGGGGGSRMGGGGGAGGALYASTQTFNAGTLYTALIGAGGAGGAATNSGSFPGTQGGNSQISNLNAVGGGFGSLGNSASATDGGNGGSGGGGGSKNSSSTAGGSPTSGQGNAGGSSFAEAYSPSGGGGGAGAVGGNATATAGGNGGAGSTNYTTWHSITGTGVLSGSLYYIAGGGGGVRFATAATTGGIGGGGAGATQNPSNPFNGTAGVAGTANTGGGGGGGGQSGVDTSPQYQALAGGAGGSGLIIVRYPLS